MPSWLFLVSAIVFASLFSIIFKICQIRGIDSRQVILLNFVTAALLTWIPAGVGLLSSSVQCEEYALSGKDVLICAAQGLLFILGFIVMDRSVWRSGVALTTTMSKSSLVLPVILSWLLLSQPEPKWIPVAMVLAALLLIILPNQSQKKEGRTNISDKERNIRSVLLLAVVFFTFGISDFFLKIVQSASSGENHLNSLMGMVFVWASVIGVGYCLMPSKYSKGLHFSKGSIIGGLALGLANNLCTGSVLKALCDMDTAVFYPLYNIGIVVLSTIVGVFLFKEKLKWIQFAGLALAIVAITMFF